MVICHVKLGNPHVDCTLPALLEFLAA